MSDTAGNDPEKVPWKLCANCITNLAINKLFIQFVLRVYLNILYNKNTYYNNIT